MWGIYVHVPWCRRRCRYCDFYFEIGKAQGGFAERVLQEFDARRKNYPANPAKTLYFGGGTPSSVDALEIALIIDGLKARGDLEAAAEITLEANPEDMALEKLEALRKAGVDRLSIGIQSFDPSILRYLGRKHTPAMAKECIVHAQTAGFSKVSIDLIGGVPEEKLAHIHQDMLWALEHGVKHVSFYLLTVEDGTPLFNHIRAGKIQAIDDDVQASAYEHCQTIFEQLGLRQYEVSSFAVPGCESTHNRIYWSKGQYIGLGPGAHSMELLETGEVIRRATIKSLEQWWKNPVDVLYEQEHLTAEEALREALAFGLRDVVAGIDPKDIAKNHCTTLPAGLDKCLQKLAEKELIVIEGGRVRLSKRGTLFADLVAREILGA